MMKRIEFGNVCVSGDNRASVVTERVCLCFLFEFVLVFIDFSVCDISSV